jgi:hypothetical protein
MSKARDSVPTTTTAPGKSHAPPLGFRFAAAAAGVKEAGAARKDVALIVSETPCVAAGTFTVNRMRAAPVDYAASRLPTTGICRQGGGEGARGPSRRRADRLDGRDRHPFAR